MYLKKVVSQQRPIHLWSGPSHEGCTFTEVLPKPDTPTHLFCKGKEPTATIAQATEMSLWQQLMQSKQGWKPNVQVTSR